MPATVYLPSQFKIGAIFQFVRSVIGEDGRPLSDHVLFDFSRLSFINGEGLTVLSNTAEWLKRRGVRVSFATPPIYGSAISYLDDCGFFRMYLGRPLREGAAPRGTTLPLRRVQHEESHSWIENTAGPWLEHALGIAPAGLGTIRTCLKEIFNNIQDHSTENIGCSHIQEYPNLDRVAITISDFGKGIPDNIRKIHPGVTDVRALFLATQEGVTTRSTPRNLGAGLSVLADYVTLNYGVVKIYSGKAGVRCERKLGGSVRWTPVVGTGTYPGTLIDINLDRNRFIGDEVERQDLEW